MLPSSSPPRTGVATVYRTWWPLAASWLLMGFELPAVSAVMARLAHPEIHLAAYGGVVFPLALLIESPIIMLLSASTALCKDWASYLVVRRYMLLLGGAMTAFHVLIAFTPLYDFVVGHLMAAPAEVLEPARIGLQIMTPWTLSIAYRRTQQGVLIRFGHSKAVGIGTLVRLAGNALVLAIGYAVGSWPGIVVGTLAVAVGVMGEAVYAAWRVHPVLEHEVKPSTAVAPPLSAQRFWRFYTPLLVTPLFMLLTLPMASAAMSRMPRTIESLAVWPVLNGLVFLLRSLGFAFNEVVVAMIERPGAVAALKRFALGLAFAVGLLLLLVAATPLGGFWFGRVSALPPHLTAIATTGLWFAILLPSSNVFQSLFQGTIVHSHETRGITESVVILLVTVGGLLAAGVARNTITGLYVALGAMVIGNLVQAAWLWYRARKTWRSLEARDAAADGTVLAPVKR